MYKFLIVVLLLSSFQIVAQRPKRNLKVQLSPMDTLNICYHNNKKISTEARWDKDLRFGKFKCYDAKGKLLFEYGLRKIAGHASVWAEYYKNGQVRKATLTSAPDGGIQYYHEEYTFDENGNQTSYVDLSMPDGHPVLMVPKEFRKLQEVKN
jgi:antitoxin component YwqK of YwqJK toxin-antitoxin module